MRFLTPNIQSTRRFVLPLGLALLLASCASPPPLPVEPSFSNLPPFRLNVARVEVVTKYQTPTVAPHIELAMPFSPEKAARRWVQDRIVADGRTGTLRVVINNASATETPQGSVDMSIALALQVLDDQQNVAAEVSGDSSRNRIEPQGEKPNERNQFLTDTVKDLMQGFNGQIEPSIAAAFGPWLGAVAHVSQTPERY